MKKLWIIGIMLLCLTGCKTQQSMETVSDTLLEPAVAQRQQAVVSLPAEASSQTISMDEVGTVYFCDGYVVTVNTVPAGDLHKTVTDATGFSPEQLCMIRTQKDGVTRHSCVWTAVTEEGDQVGKCVVLDDGAYHYVLTAMAPAQQMARLTEGDWKEIFGSFRLMHPQDVVSSGS